MTAIALLSAAGRRIARALVLLLVVSTLLFASVAVLPGDPATVILGVRATPSQIAALRAELHLDESPPLRYLYWLGQAVQGEFGTSVGTDRPVTDLIGDRLVATLTLGLLAFTVVIALSLPLGLWMGSRPGGRTDTGVSTASLLLLSVPEFVIAGLLLALFAFWLRAFPPVSLIPAGSGALSQPQLLVLPVLALVLPTAAWSTRLVRASVLDGHRLPHVEAARLSGMAESRVLLRHLLPSTLAPIGQVFALLAGFVVGGAIVVENIFGYPGLGTLLVAAVRQRNVPVVQTLGLLMAAAVILAFLLADLLTLAVNPTIRNQQR